MARIRLMVAATSAVAVLAAAPAHAFVYFTSSAGSGTEIERANNDGTGVQPNFEGGQLVHAIGITASNFYFAEDASSGAVSEAGIDASATHEIFTADYTKAFAFDAGHMYLADQADNTIERANLDGTGFNPTFVAGANGPSGVAVDSQYVYWSNPASGSIGRALLTDPSTPKLFVTGLADPIGVVVAAGYVYWADEAGNEIGRAPVSGVTLSQPNFITGANAPYGLATDGTYLYWVNTGNGTIGKAKLDGTGVTESLISGVTNGEGIAADTRTAPPPVMCVVPKLIGKTLSRAKALLTAAHCKLGKVTRPRHAKKHAKLVVSAQHPAARTKLPSGAKVNVTLKAAKR